MSTLIVALPLTSANVASEYDYVLTHEGRTPASASRAPAALLPRLQGAGNEVVALVPARALSWHQVACPASVRGNPQRLRAALAGLLEEQLLDDPDQLHLAIFPGAQADQPLWVAACNKAWLHQALQALESAQLAVARIVPELAPALDEAAATLNITTALEPAALLLSSPRGVSCLPLGPAAIALAAWPQTAEVVAEPAVAALAEQAFKRPVRLQTENERWLQAAAMPWNLAQFDLERSRRSRALQMLARGGQALLRAPQWRAARWGALALVLIQVLGLNAWAWREQNAQATQRAAIQQLFKQTFPETPVIVDAPLQMARAVAALQQTRGQTGPQGLDALLSVMGSATPAGQTLQALEFNAGQAKLQGLRLSPTESAELIRQLQTRGWQARQEGEQLVVHAGGGS